MLLDIADAESRSEGSVYAVPPVGDAPLKLGDHAFSLTGDPDTDRSPGDAELERLFETTCRQLAAPERYRLLSGRTCFYTVAPDLAVHPRPRRPAPTRWPAFPATASSSAP
ncbi:MAG: hypothetical protein U5L06_04895 [Rhodovibrio sp.]|nr:hypothetical protein [Rhodovibrio sp.]